MWMKLHTDQAAVVVIVRQMLPSAEKTCAMVCIDTGMVRSL